MTELAKLQQRFMRFLTGAELKGEGFCELVEDNLPGASVDTRCDIYRNAYRLRLREAIDNDHEVLGLYLGDDLFEEMVTGYITQHPSHYKSLRHFATDLPNYLHHTPPFREHPIIAEIAAFERLLLDVFDAPDAERAILADVQSLQPEQWPTMQLRFHPSVQFFHAQWNSVESWQKLHNKEAPDSATSQPDSLWLLWRGEDRLSQFRSCDGLEWQSLQLGVRGADFASLCEAATKQIPEQGVSAAMAEYLGRWLESGLITTVVV